MSRLSFQPNEALVEMMANDREDEPLGGYAGELLRPPVPEPEPPPAPLPVRIPPVDWRAEEAERDAELLAAPSPNAKGASTFDERIAEPEPDPKGYPAKRRRASKTPNLDKVRAWRAEEAAPPKESWSSAIGPRTAHW
jgi:hypothetical protein